MNPEPPGRSALPSWVVDPALADLWVRVQRRFESNGLVATGRLRVVLADRAQRHALGDLLGETVTGERVVVDLEHLDRRVRERAGVDGLGEALPLLTGQALRDRPGQRAESQARRDAPLALAAELVPHPWAQEWAAGLRRTGLLTNRADALDVVRAAAVVLTALVGEWTVPRSRVEIAARLLGDAHALDEGRLLHRVVLRGLAAAAGQLPPATAEERRAVWEQYGVERDLLSRTCLTLGLHPPGGSDVAKRLRAAAAAGDPVHLTSWDLRKLETRWPGSGPVLVCENPRILESVAETYGGHRPAVCVSGEPNTVVLALLDRLADGGHAVRYHGDFDWPGLAIANRLVARVGARPWLMDVDSYLDGVRDEGPALRGERVEPSWDAALGPAMAARGRALHEETVVDRVLAALPDLDVS